jgi:outer membrane protein
VNEVDGVLKKAALLTLALSVFPLTQAEELNTGMLPKWELGLGLAALSLPDYPGADQGRSYVLPFPYLIYRGERLKANRDGLRGLLFEHPRWDLDISAGGSLPVNSKDNRAREGMDDLDFSFEFGPLCALNYVIPQLKVYSCALICAPCWRWMVFRACLMKAGY